MFPTGKCAEVQITDAALANGEKNAQRSPKIKKTPIDGTTYQFVKKSSNFKFIFNLFLNFKFNRKFYKILPVQPLCKIFASSNKIMRICRFGASQLKKWLCWKIFRKFKASSMDQLWNPISNIIRLQPHWFYNYFLLTIFGMATNLFFSFQTQKCGVSPVNLMTAICEMKNNKTFCSIIFCNTSANEWQRAQIQ